MTSPLETFRDRLAPGIADYLTRSSALFAHGAGDMTVARQRALFRNMCRLFAAVRPPGLAVRDEAVAARGRMVPIRIYRPEGEGIQPALLYFHGGGAPGAKPACQGRHRRRRLRRHAHRAR